MQRLLTLTILLAATSLVQATPVYHPPGSNLTYGATSGSQSIMSNITNPAAAAAVLKKNGNEYQFGILGSFGIGFEVGKVDDVMNRLTEQANNAFDAATGETIGFDITDPTVVNISTLAEASAALDAAINTPIASINSILQELDSDDAYAKFFISGHLPVTPVVVAHEVLNGSLIFDVNGSLNTKFRGYHAAISETSFGNDIISDFLDNGVIDNNYNEGGVSINYTDTSAPTFSLSNDTTVLISAVSTIEMSLGYSRHIRDIKGGALYTGIIGHYYKVGKARSAIKLTDLEDAEQKFNDAADAGFQSDSGFGVDVGVLWINDLYQLGATLKNINEPNFDFGDVVNIGTYTDTSIRNRIQETNTYILQRQITVEGSVYTENQNWVISTAMDLSAVEDALGDDYQWATISAAYATDTWYIPGIRVGLRQNMSGTKVKYLTGGLSLGALSLDIAYSPETITIDGSSIPRGAIFNLGLDVTF